MSECGISSSDLYLGLVGRHAVRVNPQFSNRMIEASRSVLNRYIPDIYLYSDVYKGEESGQYVVSPPLYPFGPHLSTVY